MLSFLGHTQSCLGLLLAGSGGTVRDARNPTWVCYMQGKCPTCCVSLWPWGGMFLKIASMSLCARHEIQLWKDEPQTMFLGTFDSKPNLLLESCDSLFAHCFSPLEQDLLNFLFLNLFSQRNVTWLALPEKRWMQYLDSFGFEIIFSCAFRTVYCCQFWVTPPPHFLIQLHCSMIPYGVVFKSLRN